MHALDAAVLEALRERAASGRPPTTMRGLTIRYHLGFGPEAGDQIAERMAAEGLVTVGADGRVETRQRSP